ncbi:uncharacterized protein METZ01_LOCUS433626, partial [marine metagenome]
IKCGVVKKIVTFCLIQAAIPVTMTDS